MVNPASKLLRRRRSSLPSLLERAIPNNSVDTMTRDERMQAAQSEQKVGSGVEVLAKTFRDGHGWKERVSQRGNCACHTNQDDTRQPEPKS